jgi:hypothetical protein
LAYLHPPTHGYKIKQIIIGKKKNKEKQLKLKDEN